MQTLRGDDMAMSNDSIVKIFLVTLGVCVVCAILVATTTVTLRERQEVNKQLDKIENILSVSGLEYNKQNIFTVYDDKIKPLIIELETGEEIQKSQFNKDLNIENFNIKKLSNHSKYGKSISPTHDLANIKKMPKYMLIYLVTENDELKKLILPIYGKGLWSTLYGFIAIDGDLKTITGLTFYEHGETPGLGGEVDNPRWKQIWAGKKAFDDNWNLKIEVIKGKVDKSSEEAIYHVDGLSGSTLTTRGVDNLVKFWLGENGYGPYFQKLREKLNGQN
ncbi:MAG: Na(+)-translocating NADH-quinone reductase subunit C [Ignavibacteriales bacterium]|nr:Na(+)-translocating NADH-quinone reductase subunit C [Ignavibacteriales bacterium]